MRKTLTLFLLFCASFCTPFSAISQSVEWFETIDQQRNPYTTTSYITHQPLKIVADDDHLFCFFKSTSSIIGFERSGDTVAYDPLPLGRYYDENTLVIAKYTTNGELKWAERLRDNLWATPVVAIKGDYLYVATVLSRSIVFRGDSISLNTQAPSVLLIKMDKNGKLIWSKKSASLAFPNIATLKSLVIDNEENIFLGGDILPQQSLFFDNLRTEASGLQFVFQFDKNGKPLKAHTLFDRSDKEGSWIYGLKEMKINEKGELFVLTDFAGRNTTISCAYSRSRASIYKIPIGKAIEHVASVHCSDLMIVSSFELDTKTKDFYLTGRFRGQMGVDNFKSDNVSCENMSAFLMRLMPDGRVLWFKKGLNNEFSDGYRLLRENDGSFLWAGIQSYDFKNPNISHRYPNVKSDFPDGKTRLFVRRISPVGEQLDSIIYFIGKSYRDAAFHNIWLAQSKNQTFIFGNYDCHFDSLSASICYKDWHSFEKMFLLKVSDNQLKKKLPVLNYPTLDWAVTSAPNPTSEYAFLNFAKPTKESVLMSLYDLTGRIIQQQTFETGTQTIFIDLNNAPNGLYLVKMSSGEKQLTIKLVKN